MQSLDDIFIDALAAAVTVQLPDKRAYENLRTMLLRKMRKYNQVQISFDMPADCFMQCRWNAETSSGTFQALPVTEKTELRNKLYIVSSPNEL
jgi:hypothetical protein